MTYTISAQRGTIPPATKQHFSTLGPARSSQFRSRRKRSREVAMQEATQTRANGPAALEWLSDPDLDARRLEVHETRILYHPPDSANNAYYLESGQVRIFQTA